MGPPPQNGHAWVTGNLFQVSGLCRAMEHTMGPQQQNGHAWAVRSNRAHNGPATTEWSCVGCAQQCKTRWARKKTMVMRGLCRANQHVRPQHAHLVALVDLLQPLQAKSQSASFLQATCCAFFYVHMSVGNTVDVDDLPSHRHDSVSDSSIAQRSVLVLDPQCTRPLLVLWNVVQGGRRRDGVESTCARSPSAILKCTCQVSRTGARDKIFGEPIAELKTIRVGCGGI
jgi:hypothetical protein